MMKSYLSGIILIMMICSLFGCQQYTEDTAGQNREETDKGFAEPEPSDWIKYNKLILQYMYYRTQAVQQNDITVLWNKYPDLKVNDDPQKGINVEKEEVESLNNGRKWIDANYSIESHERMKVKTVNEEEAIVLVHGGINYISNDFDKAGGEVLIEISLKLKNNHWTVVQTDEYTELEYKEWMQKQAK
ncbi:hypothetical protein [Bacillus badius]|uniref:hypothetical protein n=1 Tax=Bacillus badius TaxID=1455 RepID=UPI0012E02D84|nr:hypothetical protein [Bacillus badius]